MKQIVYTCTDSGITPSVPQKAGVQGDCEVTEIILDITAVTLPDTPLFRIEVADGSGHFTAYTDLTVTDDVIDEVTHKRIHFLVPLAVTDAGGMATMHLVISNETEVMYTYPAMLSFKGSTYGCDTRLDYTHDMSDMLQYASDLIGGYQGALLGKVDKVEGKGLSTNDYTDSDKSLVQTINTKQDKLTAGDNITIVDNVISATGGGGSGAVDDVLVDGVSVVSSGIANIDLSGKANASDVYTKQEVNTKLQTKAPLSDVDILFDTIGNVPETTTVQAEIDSLDTRVTYLEEHGGGGDTTRLDNIVAVLRQLMKKATYTEDVTGLIAELDSYFDEGGVIQNGSMLTIRGDVTVVQDGNMLTIS